MSTTEKTLPGSLQELHILDEDVRKWLGLAEGGGDRVTSQWFGVDSIKLPLAVVAVYLAFVFTTHQKIRPIQWNIKPILVIYNIIQVVACGYLVIEYIKSLGEVGFSNYICLEVGSTSSELGLRVATYIYWYHVLKYIDLMDTVFFILKGNIRQVTVLHVFHHATMIINSWIAVRHDPVGQTFFIGLINLTIHAIMYTYYLLSTFGPTVQKYLWWKRYITQLQMIQFIIIISIYFSSFAFSCMPEKLGIYVISYNFVMLGLFGNFYINSYNKRKLVRRSSSASKKVE